MARVDRHLPATWALLRLVERDAGCERGGFCENDPDEESVYHSEDGPSELTFGHIRRARAELEKLLTERD